MTDVTLELSAIRYFCHIKIQETMQELLIPHHDEKWEKLQWIIKQSALQHSWKSIEPAIRSDQYPKWLADLKGDRDMLHLHFTASA